jgi:hypothetical protein
MPKTLAPNLPCSPVQPVALEAQWWPSYAGLAILLLRLSARYNQLVCLVSQR